MRKFCYVSYKILIQFIWVATLEFVRVELPSFVARLYCRLFFRGVRCRDVGSGLSVYFSGLSCVVSRTQLGLWKFVLVLVGPGVLGSSIFQRTFSLAGIRSLIANPRCRWGLCHTVWFMFLLFGCGGTAGSTYRFRTLLRGQKRCRPSDSWCRRGPRGSFVTIPEIVPYSVSPI